MNRVILTGRLVRDVTTKEFDSGNTVYNFTIANNTGYRDRNGDPKTVFVECQAWNNTAKGVSPYLLKGTLVAVEAQLDNRELEFPDTGKKMNILVVKVDRIELLGGKNNSGSNNSGNATPTAIDEDDCPF